MHVQRSSYVYYYVFNKIELDYLAVDEPTTSDLKAINSKLLSTKYNHNCQMDLSVSNVTLRNTRKPNRRTHPPILK